MNIETILIQFMILYFCNLILDYPLQGEYLANGKSESNYLLWVHSSIWALGISIILLPLGLFTWAKVIMLIIGHYCIDYWKARKLYQTVGYTEIGKIKRGLTDNQALYVDQVLHIIQLLLCLM